jgi:DNA-binding XRE family transcriptional regulator
MSMSAAELNDVPPLTVLIESATAHSLEPRNAPVVIGREAPADIRVADYRISRRHLVLSVRDGHWVGTDPGSTNGTFISGERVEEFDIPNDELTVKIGHPAAGISITFSTLDAGIVFAGAAVAKRRKDLDISQRKLAEDKIINAGALISFEKGRSWPRQSTRETLESVLGWPRGKIGELRRDVAAGGMTTTVSIDADRTVNLPAREATGVHTIEPSFLVQWADQSLAAARTHRADLPAPDNRDYPAQVARLIAELSGLESLVHNASGAPELRAVFLGIRTEMRDVMLQAAASRCATAGQLLFAARDRARLSVEDAAMLAGVSPASIKSFEVGAAVSPEDTALLNNFLASLQ